MQSLAGNLVKAGFGFLTFLILARTYDKEIFGEWVLFLTGSTFIEMIRVGITKTALVRFLSGAKAEYEKKLTGSNLFIGLAVSTFNAIILYAALWLFPDAIKESGFELFFKWYPIWAFINLPYSNALTVLQAKQKFDVMLYIRFANSFMFFAGVIINYFWLQLSLDYIVILRILTFFIVGLVIVYFNYDGSRNLKYTTKSELKTILDFGKYTTITLIGTNLLKSADTFILALSPLGVTAVALYSIPLKLTEVLQIPLRSFVSTAFPKMSKASMENNMKMVRYYFYSYGGSITIMFIPVILGCVLFSDFFIMLLGGEKYLGVDPVTGESASLIFKIFALYSLMLPLDRLTGVGLDSINKPKKNFYKIIIMVIANIIGDLIAVFVFESLLAVALVTVLFTFIGLVLGYYYFNKEVPLNFRMIWIEGYKTFILKYNEFVKGIKK